MHYIILVLLIILKHVGSNREMTGAASQIFDVILYFAGQTIVK